MKNQWLMINQLDHQLKDWQTIARKYNSRPNVGWVKTIREALSMSSQQLANRLGLSRARVAQLEHAENNDGVTLRTLKEVADALGCEFVYAIVPKGNSTLEEIIKKRAEQIAMERVARVAHTMSLEDQSINTQSLTVRVKEQTKQYLTHLNKKLWTETLKSEIKKPQRKQKKK